MAVKNRAHLLSVRLKVTLVGAAFWFGSFVSPATAEQHPAVVLRLKDGKTVNGRLIEIRPQEVLMQVSHVNVAFTRTQIERVASPETKKLFDEIDATLGALPETEWTMLHRTWDQLRSLRTRTQEVETDYQWLIPEAVEKREAIEAYLPAMRAAAEAALQVQKESHELERMVSGEAPFDPSWRQLFELTKSRLSAISYPSPRREAEKFLDRIAAQLELISTRKTEPFFLRLNDWVEFEGGEPVRASRSFSLDELQRLAENISHPGLRSEAEKILPHLIQLSENTKESMRIQKWIGKIRSQLGDIEKQLQAGVEDPEEIERQIDRLGGSASELPDSATKESLIARLSTATLAAKAGGIGDINGSKPSLPMSAFYGIVEDAKGLMEGNRSLSQVQHLYTTVGALAAILIALWFIKSVKRPGRSSSTREASLQRAMALQPSGSQVFHDEFSSAPDDSPEDISSIPDAIPDQPMGESIEQPADHESWEQPTPGDDLSFDAPSTPATEENLFPPLLPAISSGSLEEPVSAEADSSVASFSDPEQAPFSRFDTETPVESSPPAVDSDSDVSEPMESGFRDSGETSDEVTEHIPSSSAIEESESESEPEGYETSGEDVPDEEETKQIEPEDHLDFSWLDSPAPSSVDEEETEVVDEGTLATIEEPSPISEHAAAELPAEDLFREELRAALEHARSNGHGLAVLLIQIDDPISLMNGNGSGIANKVLRETASTLKKIFRPRDILTEFEGNRFAALVPRINQIAALPLGLRIRHNIQNMSIEDVDSPVKVTVSVGISYIGERDSDLDEVEIISRAGDSLEKAREEGGNRVILYGFADQKAL